VLDQLGIFQVSSAIIPQDDLTYFLYSRFLPCWMLINPWMCNILSYIFFLERTMHCIWIDWKCFYQKMQVTVGDAKLSVNIFWDRRLNPVEFAKSECNIRGHWIFPNYYNIKQLKILFFIGYIQIHHYPEHIIQDQRCNHKCWKQFIMQFFTNTTNIIHLPFVPEQSTSSLHSSIYELYPNFCY
jgi:hypothetical protein